MVEMMTKVMTVSMMLKTVIKTRQLFELVGSIMVMTITKILQVCSCRASGLHQVSAPKTCLARVCCGWLGGGERGGGRQYRDREDIGEVV